MKLLTRALALCILLAASNPLLARAPEEPLADADLPARIRSYVGQFDEQHQVSGNLLVARKGKIILEASYGMANYELGVPNSPETRFNVASITKPMTIAIACRLLEEEKAGTSDPVSRWIPDFPRGDRITLTHLLNHRAGIPHRVTTPLQESEPHSAADMVEMVKKAEFLFEPGEKSVYSSAGFSVLARIIELIEKKPYGEVLREKVLEPAGMTHSGHPFGGRLIPDRALSYLPGAGGPMNAALKDLSFLVGAGSVYSTTRDIQKLMTAVLDGRLGETAKANLVRENGLRWNGITNGYRAFADYHKELEATVIFLGNMHTGAAELMRDNIPKILAGEEAPPPPVMHMDPVQVDLDLLKTYEGTYKSERGQEIVFKADEYGVWAGTWVLVPTGPDTFFSPQDYGKVTMVKDDKGHVIRMDWLWKGELMVPYKPLPEPENPSAS